MADNENKAVIVFADGESIYVQSTVKQIHDEIGGVTTPHIPLIKVVDEHGVDLWMNANHIRAFHEFVAGRPIGRERRALSDEDLIRLHDDLVFGESGVATTAAQRDAEKAATQAGAADRRSGDRGAEVAARQETKRGVFDSMREGLSRFQQGAQGRDPDS